jgi:hypothetical protein
MMATHYPEALQRLLRACSDFRAEGIGLDDLKSIVWETASTVVSIEEARFSEYLQALEGRLDMIQFTTDEVRSEALKVVAELETRTRAHFAAETDTGR